MAPGSLLVVLVLLAPSVSAHPSPLGFTRTAPFHGMHETLATNVSSTNQTRILHPNAFNLSSGVGVTSSRASWVNSRTTPVASWTLVTVLLNATFPIHASGTHKITVTWHFSYDAALFASRNGCPGTCFQGSASVNGFVWADLTTLSGTGVANRSSGPMNGSFVHQTISATHKSSASWTGDVDRSVFVLSFTATVTGGTLYSILTGYSVYTWATFGAATFDMGGSGDDQSRLVSIAFA
ncbi:MAG: hypothetical protein L3K19_08170 [Thermoplasmata archaeon]|nr:hypothetical protein [Thermoplasmata archaeon]